MKLLAYLLIAIGLAVGAASATNAYLWPTDLPDEAYRLGEHADGTPRYLALSAPAGRDPAGRPILPASTLENPVELTPQRLAELRAAQVESVRTKTFSFAYWRGRWWFVGACVLLVGGALLVRRETARELRAAVAAGGDGDTMTPQAAGAMLRGTLGALNEEADRIRDDHARNALIVEHVGRLQREAVPAIVEARSRLVAQMGLGHYAEFMDRFSTFERQLNRAWSSAADGASEEALACLTRADTLLDEVTRLLPDEPTRDADGGDRGPSMALPALGGGMGSATIAGLDTAHNGVPLFAADGPENITEAPSTGGPEPTPPPPPAPSGRSDDDDADRLLEEFGIELDEDRPRPSVDPYAIQELAEENNGDDENEEDNLRR